MTKDELILRLRKFAVRIIKMVDEMPNTISSNAIARQVVRSGTSPSANYRAACVGKSEKDFINKLKIVQEELDETSNWLEIIVEAGIMKAERMKLIREECDELYKIIVSSIMTMKNRLDPK